MRDFSANLMQKIGDAFSKEKMMSFASSLLAVLIAFLIGGLMTAFTDSSPMEAYEALYKGAFGSANTVKQTIRYAIPIITLAISFAVGRQGGLFNIGQEAQMISAAVVALWINTTFSTLPQPVLLVLMLLGGMIASALCAVIPAMLKYFFGVNEAMLFLMMNYIAQQIIQYMLLYTPLAMPGSAASPKSIAFTVQLPWKPYTSLWLHC